MDNRLLAALPAADWQRWAPQLERVDLSRGQPLHQPGRIQRHAYFPAGAVVAVEHGSAPHASTEVALVGREGMVGTALFLGRSSTTGRATVMLAGPAYRVRVHVLREAFDRSEAVRRLLLRYAQALATQIAQTAACNRLHSVHQQVCSWLLQSLDRLQASELDITQGTLAGLLGVRRESVTEVEGHLQAAGLIRHSRGHVVVLDRAGLERQSCECHAVVLEEYERLLPRGRAPELGAPAHRSSA